MRNLNSLLAILFSFFCSALMAQNTEDSSMDFETYDPISTLVVPENPITSAKFPFIDVHSHQWNLTKERIGRLVEEINGFIKYVCDGQPFGKRFR